MAEGDFFTFLQRCLEAIRSDARAAYRALCEQLSDLLVHLTVNGARGTLIVGSRSEIVVTQDPAIMQRASAAPKYDVQLETSRDTVAALVDGRLSLLEALLLDALLLRGATDAVVLAYDALMLFLKGAVRSPEVPALLDAYLGRRRVPIRPIEQEAS